MEHRYKVTTHGRAVLAACTDLQRPPVITRAAVGNGLIHEGDDLADRHELIQYVSEAAIADRRHEGDRLFLTVQYANVEHQAVGAFAFSEFMVFCQDPETGQETDLLYGTLGDYRQPVPGYSDGFPASVWNYPIVLAVSSELEIAITASPGLATFEDLLELKTALSSKAGAVPPVWHDLTLTETFVPDGDGDDAANRYCWDQFGRVTVRLLCKMAAEGGISSEYNVARLPAGSRPNGNGLTYIFRDRTNNQVGHINFLALERLRAEDQINLSAAMTAVDQGAEGVSLPFGRPALRHLPGGGYPGHGQGGDSPQAGAYHLLQPPGRLGAALLCVPLGITQVTRSL